MRQSPTYSVGSRFPLANREQVRQYLDPNNYKTGVYKYQFLDLSAPAGISEEELRAFLQNKGIFAGKEKVFINAAAKYNINVIYLVAHACLETGNGTSQFATGIEINGKKVYNMFGISVFDNDEQAGVEFALKNGWTTPEAAIEGARNSFQMTISTILTINRILFIR
jgi:type VI secretion system secreted protein VgrG